MLKQAAEQDGDALRASLAAAAAVKPRRSPQAEQLLPIKHEVAKILQVRCRPF